MSRPVGAKGSSKALIRLAPQKPQISVDFWSLWDTKLWKKDLVISAKKNNNKKQNN